MRKFSFLFIYLLMALLPANTRAQQYHFIYLQTENRQPFYVKLEKQVISSAASGYCILPKLRNGDYRLQIGFPGKEVPEQAFRCTVNDRDAGYLIRNLGEKGWSLFNLQTLESVAALTAAAPAAAPAKTDEFSAMLSEVVNDPSIRQAPAKEKPEPVAVQAAPPAAAAAPEPVVAPAVVPEPRQTAAVQEKPALPAPPRILQRNTDAQGERLIYLDSGLNGQTDTIEVWLPLEPAAVPAAADTQAIQVPDTTVAVLTKTTPVHVPETAVEPPVTPAPDNKAAAPDPRFLPVEVHPAAGADSVVNAVPPMINSDCRELATDEDFLKLRKKMAGAADEDAMLAAAQKVFRSRCFSTDQVKNLGVLFLKDAGRYRFFDLAYPHVSDSHQFPSLENQLTDAYFINRFRAMVRR